jgi:hypothetical protein
MGLTEVQDVPRDAEHDPDQDTRLPDGRLLQTFVADDGAIFQRVTLKGKTRNFRVDADAKRVRLCGARHGMHTNVRCDGPKGHDGDHFASFFMRSWEQN